MRLVTILVLGVLLSGCASFERVPPPRSGLAFQKGELRLSSDGVVFDLLSAIPVRSARLYDLLSQETFTRRYFLVHAGGRQYALKTEQHEGEPYPRRILVETRDGFRRVILDGAGNIVRAEPAADLGE